MPAKPPGALLTPSQRAFLRGEKEVSQPAKTRYDIRERVRCAFTDLALLFNQLEQRDRYQIFYNKEMNELYQPIGYGPGDDFPELVWEAIEVEEFDTLIGAGGMRQAHAFMYLSLLRGLTQEYEIPIDSLVSELVARSLQDMYGKIGRVSNVNVSIDVDFPDANPQELLDRFEKGGDLTDKELEWLIHLRLVNYSLLQKYIQDM